MKYDYPKFRKRRPRNNSKWQEQISAQPFNIKETPLITSQAQQDSFEYVKNKASKEVASHVIFA